MDVSEFSYVWTTQRDDYVIYSLDYPYVEVGDSYAFLMDSGLSDEANARELWERSLELCGL